MERTKRETCDLLIHCNYICYFQFLGDVLHRLIVCLIVCYFSLFLFVVIFATTALSETKYTCRATKREMSDVWWIKDAKSIVIATCATCVLFIILMRGLMWCKSEWSSKLRKYLERRKTEHETKFEKQLYNKNKKGLQKRQRVQGHNP